MRWASARSTHGEFEPPEGPEEPEALEVTIPVEWDAGVYANTSMVSFTRREFTIDFIRIRPRQTSGVLVARISCSSHAAMELCVELESQLRLWVEQVLSDRGDGNGHAL
jgi:hypothetical protein